MGQKKSKHGNAPVLDQAILRRITTATLFLPDEIQYFYYDFLKYTPKGYLIVADFEKFYQTLFLAGEPENFSQYAFNAYDTNRDGKVDFEEFITGLYYTTKAPTHEKIRWAFDLCDRDNDHQLDVPELEAIIQALYELSDPDMSRLESYHEAIERVKTLFLANHEDESNDDLLDSVTKSEFVDIVQKDTAILKLIDCRPAIKKTTVKAEQHSNNPFKKHLKFKPTMQKSLSDSTLERINRQD